MQMGSYETLDGCSDARGKATQQKFFFFASSIPKYSFCIYNTKKKYIEASRASFQNVVC